MATKRKVNKRKITRDASERIYRQAFNAAKARFESMSDGYLRAAAEKARRYDGEPNDQGWIESEAISDVASGMLLARSGINDEFLRG